TAQVNQCPERIPSPKLASRVTLVPGEPALFATEPTCLHYDVQTGSLSGVSLLDLLYDLCDELVKGDALQQSRDRDDHVQVRTNAVLQFDGHQRVDTQSAELLVSIELE